MYITSPPFPLQSNASLPSRCAPAVCVLSPPPAFHVWCQRVGTVVSNLSKVPENRMTLLKELVSVAKSLGSVSTHDLQSLGAQLGVAKKDAVARVSWNGGVGRGTGGGGGGGVHLMHGRCRMHPYNAGTEHGGREEWGEVYSIPGIVHGRSRMAIDPRIPIYNAGTEHVGFSPTRQTVLAPKAQSTVRCRASRM